MKARYETMGIRLEQRPWRMFRLSSSEQQPDDLGAVAPPQHS